MNPKYHSDCRLSRRSQGDQLFDVICVGIHLVAVAALRRLDAGALYFWIKDLTQEFLKLSIIYSSVEIFDKVRHLYISAYCSIPYITNLKVNCPKVFQFRPWICEDTSQ